MIVIDEFASLAEDLPDFVRGLVGIAQRGRSLGIHLVLATQRPAGVVSPRHPRQHQPAGGAAGDRRGGVPRRAGRAGRRRHRAVAARPGLRPHRAGALLPFQTARVGGRRPGTAPERLQVHEVPWSELGLPLPVAPTDEPADDATDLHALVEAVRSAAAGLEPVASPWLPPLPEAVLLPPARPLVLPFGIEDLPDVQAQRPAVLDLVHGGHLLVAGAPRSGRTTLLRTLAGSLAAGTTADDVHLYAIDCGSGGLAGLTELPHTGAVVTRTEAGRADRLLARLTTEVARRQELLAAAGWADLAEQRAGSADPLPYLLLLVDRWEGFLAAFDELDAGRLTEALLRLVREGLSAGLRVVVTGDRTVLLGKLSQTIEDTVVLRLAERSDYALAGLSPRSLPMVVGAGRGFRGGTGTELQVGLLTPDPSGSAQVAALSALSALAATAAAGGRPFRVDPLPSRVGWDAGLPAEPCGIAVGGDELTVLGIDAGAGFTVIGPPGSGRSTALAGLAGTLLAAGRVVLALTPRPSALRAVEGVVHVTGAPDLVPVLNACTGPLSVLVDDAELLLDDPVSDVLVQVLREGRQSEHGLVVAGAPDALARAFRGFAAEVRASRSGLLLGLTDHLHGELLGVRLPRSAVAPGPAGRGLLVRAGVVTPVQVPR